MENGEGPPTRREHGRATARDGACLPRAPGTSQNGPTPCGGWPPAKQWAGPKYLMYLHLGRHLEQLHAPPGRPVIFIQNLLISVH